MCGIVGIYNFDSAPIDERILINMARLISHRGPDDEGFWIGSGIGLGHRRLSIIDLTSTGHQPLCNEDESVWIVFNGEIYNYKEIRYILEGKGHQFRSQSDTEVIVHAYEEWGEACVQKLNGMFAFGIWDDRKKELFLVRDRLGVKPLYYFIDDKGIAFASEIKSILQMPRIIPSVNATAVLDYLMYQYALGDETFFRGIKKLLPGHYLRIKSNIAFAGRYWDLPSDKLRLDTKEDVGLLRDEVESLLTDSVRLRLRSDVEVGCYLSGGIDSSIVTGLAAGMSRGRLKSFTGKFSEHPEFDETYYAKLVSDYAKTEYHELNIELNSVKSRLPSIIWHMDEPNAGPGVVPQYFISELASKYVKVVLGGQGGDELFGGYGWYRKALFAIMLRKFGIWRSVFKSTSPFRFVWNYGRNEGAIRILEGVLRFGPREEPESIYSDIRSMFSQHELGEIVEGRFHDRRMIDTQDRFMSALKGTRSEDPVSQFFKFDIRYYLPSLLHVEDRTSMAFSLESRLPFLDYRFVELACRIPSEWKVGVGDSKYILRESFRKVLPTQIYARTDKKGFPTPIEFWLKGDRGNLMGEASILGSLGANGILNENEINKIHHSVQKGRRGAAEKLWRVICILIWHKQFIEKYSEVSKGYLTSRQSAIARVQGALPQQLKK